MTTDFDQLAAVATFDGEPNFKSAFLECYAELKRLRALGTDTLESFRGRAKEAFGICQRIDIETDGSNGRWRIWFSAAGVFGHGHNFDECLESAISQVAARKAEEAELAARAAEVPEKAEPEALAASAADNF